MDYQQILTWMRGLIGPGKRFANKMSMANHIGLDESGRVPLYTALKPGKSSMPKSDTLLRWLDGLGVKFLLPNEAGIAAKPQTRDIEFVSPKMVSIHNGTPPPASEDYFAVPLAEDAVAAGPGLIGEDTIRGWVIVWRHHDSIRFRHNLVAVEIGKGQTSMTPLLQPGDIVLVDRSERTPDVDGKIMLVCDPDGGCAIKRVSSRRIDGDVELVFYSENAAVNPPRVHRPSGTMATILTRQSVAAWSGPGRT